VLTHLMKSPAVLQPLHQPPIGLNPQHAVKSSSSRYWLDINVRNVNSLNLGGFTLRSSMLERVLKCLTVRPLRKYIGRASYLPHIIEEANIKLLLNQFTVE